MHSVISTQVLVIATLSTLSSQGSTSLSFLSVDRSDAVDYAYGVFVMAESLREFTRFTQRVYHERQVAAKPWTRGVALRHRSTFILLQCLVSTFTIAIYYSYSAHRVILVLPPYGG